MRCTAAPGRGALVIRITRAAAGAKARQRVAGRRKGGDAVVHDAPDVAEKDIVVARKRSKSFDDVGQGVRDDI